MKFFFNFFNQKNKENARANTGDRNRSSLSRKNQNIILKALKSYGKKQFDFQRNYPRRNIEWGNDFQQGEIELNSYLNETETFSAIKIGRLDIQDNTWNWGWLNAKGNFLSGSPLIKVRNYGFYNKIELLTKRRWFANAKDAKEMCAISMAILSGIGVIELETKEGVDYILILDSLKG